MNAFWLVWNPLGFVEFIFALNRFGRREIFSRLGSPRVSTDAPEVPEGEGRVHQQPRALGAGRARGRGPLREGEEDDQGPPRPYM